MASLEDVRKTLKRLWETGEWSDLVVVAEGREFKVHRSVLCPAVPFFQAACASGFKETHTGVVNLPEPAAVVEILLRYIYGFRHLDDVIPPDALSWASTIGSVFVAADKYQMRDLKKSVESAIVKFVDLCCHPTKRNADILVGDIVKCGIALYEHHELWTEHINRFIVDMTAKNMSHIMTDDDAAWDTLLSAPIYHKAVVGRMLDYTVFEDKTRYSPPCSGRSTPVLNVVHDSRDAGNGTRLESGGRAKNKEALTGVVSLPEDAAVVEGVIRWIYGDIDPGFICLVPPMPNLASVMYFTRLHIAADKYGLPNLKMRSLRLACHRMSGLLSTSDIIDAGIWLYESEQRDTVDPALLRQAVLCIAQAGSALMKEDKLNWNKLIQCPDLAGDVFTLISKSSERADALKERKSEDFESEYLQSPSPT